jgi:hypothetical protein
VAQSPGIATSQTSGDNQRTLLFFRQVQGFGNAPHRVWTRLCARTPLQIADAALAQSSALSQLTLGQAAGDAEAAQKLCKRIWGSHTIVRTL